MCEWLCILYNKNKMNTWSIFVRTYLHLSSPSSSKNFHSKNEKMNIRNRKYLFLSLRSKYSVFFESIPVTRVWCDSFDEHQPPFYNVNTFNTYIIILNFAPRCKNSFNKTSRRTENHFTLERTSLFTPSWTSK